MRTTLLPVALTALLLILPACGNDSDNDAPFANNDQPLHHAKPAPKPTPQTPTSIPGIRQGPPFKAVAMQLHRVDVEFQERYKKGLESIAAIGADTVVFVVDCQQENQSSTSLYLDWRRTPSDDQLDDLIAYARWCKLRVFIMPIVSLDRPSLDAWRGNIAPQSWDDWFDAYTGIIQHFLYRATANNVEGFFIGSELSDAESHVDQWKKLIAAVRTQYKGLLSYSANWDHYDKIQFWDDLDFISMTSYWQIGEDANVTAFEASQNWQDIQKNILAFAAAHKKPVFLSEVGYPSLHNAAIEPWNYTKPDKLDTDLQNRLYQGFFRAWNGQPQLEGFDIWSWSADGGGGEDKGFTPWGKPAMRTLIYYLRKDNWTIDPTTVPTIAPATKYTAPSTNY